MLGPVMQFGNVVVQVYFEGYLVEFLFFVLAACAAEHVQNKHHLNIIIILCPNLILCYSQRK